MGIIRDLVSSLKDSQSAPQGASSSGYNPSYTVDSRVQQPSQQFASNPSSLSPQYQPSQNGSFSPPPPSYSQEYGVTTSSTSQSQPQQYSKHPASEPDPQQNVYNTRQVESSQFARPQQEPLQYIQPQPLSQFQPQPQPQIETRYYVAQQVPQDDNGGRRRGGRLRQRLQDRRGRRNGGGSPLTMVFEEVTRIGEKRFGGGNGDGYGRR